MFSMMNYFLPLKGMASMHCSANTDKEGKNTAIFFGLSLSLIHISAACPMTSMWSCRTSSALTRSTWTTHWASRRSSCARCV